MEDDIADGVFKGLLRLASLFVRTLIWLVWELFFEIIAWYVGWPICRLLSFGKYPNEYINEYEESSALAHIIVSMVGLFVLIGLGVILSPWE